MSATPIGSSKAQSIWFDSELVSQVNATWFDPDHWRTKGAISGEALGRGTTFFFHNAGKNMVLRHYRRGGLIGKILSDQYWYSGLNQTRPWRELMLLLKLQEYDLPAPRPVAAMVDKKWFYYRADIITMRIPDASDAHHMLQQHALPAENWQDIGRCIKRFHQHQIYHHDLNIHNIMLDNREKVWLIDFDKCSEKPGKDWKTANLKRLRRSLDKEKAKVPVFHFEDRNWQSLLQGYEQE